MIFQRNESQFYSNFLAFIVSLYEFPVDQSYNGLQVFCSIVSIVDVVSMLPDVDCQ
jgi:hypothetical protein